MTTTSSTDSLEQFVREHRCATHPIFEHWVEADPPPNTLAALFHQIQLFCASTRPGREFPNALRQLGMNEQSQLIQEIVASEADHGPELATMAAFIINQRSKAPRFTNLTDQEAIEHELKRCSDEQLGHVTGYDSGLGLTPQARRAIMVMLRREQTEPAATLANLGTTLALEIISNRHLIPGEKHCLVDSGRYGVDLDMPEMHYLLEHWGECGAEEQHEQNALEAVRAVLDDDPQNLARIHSGAADFLNALDALWDMLDETLLRPVTT